MNYRNVLSLWLLLALYAGDLLGQVYSDHQVHSYPASDKTSIEISNKYGKIHVITWDKDSVRFEVDLRISASNIEKMKKLKDNITFDFTATKFYVVAKTNFTGNSNKITDLVDAFIPSNQVSINYMVYVPLQANLKVENKFGDIYMDDFSGNLDITLANGDLKANSLSGNPIVRLNSGDGTINSIQNGKIYISYSDMQIKKANNLFIETRSSRIDIGRAENLNMDSRRDKIAIVEGLDVSADGYFSTIAIEHLLKELRCSFKYGNVTVDKINSNFSFININSEYTDVDLFFERGTTYNIDITHHYDVYINYPATLAQIKTEDLDVDDKTKLTFGKIGSSVKDNLPKVKISAPRKCVINIIHR